MSCIVDAADIAIVQGNNYPPIKWQFLKSEDPDVIFPLTGSIFKLRVSWPGGALTIADSSLTVDLATSMVTWTYTIAQSRELPLGRIARYELERWIDSTQQTFIAGHVAVERGDNPD